MAVPSPPLARSSNAFFPYSPSIGLASSRIAPRHKAAVPCMWAVKERQKFFHSPHILLKSFPAKCQLHLRFHQFFRLWHAGKAQFLTFHRNAHAIAQVNGAGAEFPR